jgi:hypothetical protein
MKRDSAPKNNDEVPLDTENALEAAMCVSLPSYSSSSDDDDDECFTTKEEVCVLLFIFKNQ